MNTNFKLALLFIIFLSISCKTSVTINPGKSPGPNELSGDLLTNGETYTLTGQGFGTKTPVEPLKWDNFERAELLGDRVENGWFTSRASSATLGDYPIYSNDRSRGLSNISVKQDFVTDGQYNCNFGLHVEEGFNVLFVSFYRYAKTQTGYDSSRNYKMMSLRTGGGGDWSSTSPLEFRHDIYPSGPSAHTYFQNCSGQKIGEVSSDTFELNQETWEKFDYYFNAGSIGNADGHYLRWRDGKLVGDSGNVQARTTNCSLWTNAYISGYWARDKMVCTDVGGPHYLDYCTGCDDSEERTPCYNSYCQGTCNWSWLGCQAHGGCWANFWTDDVYMDTTLAHIEICNLPTWSAKESNGAHCEIQIPKETWNDTTIKFEANKGSFATSEQLYLYVINSEGNVNEEGIEVKFN